MKNKELEMILQEGEGYKIEFKENLNNIDKEMTAFANGSGGRIFIGVADNGSVKGIKITNALRSQIQDMANNCEPKIKIHFEDIENVLVVHVRESEDKPCKCASGFYTRVGPNSQKLKRDEITEFFKSEGKIRFDEMINLKFDYRVHFDEKKLDKFLRLAGISKVIPSPDILVNLGAAEKQEGKVIFNNTGILFFAKNLDDIYHHTAVTCALYKGAQKADVLDRKDFNEDIVSNIDQTIIFLKQHIPVRYLMTGAPRRKEIPEVPFEALREAVVNAVTHRDYFEKGSNIMVEMFDDRIDITSFGGLPKGLKLEELGTKSVLRNPSIANLLNRIEYIEKMGTGINKMQMLMKEASLPPIKFTVSSFFTATFKRPEKGKDVLGGPVDFGVNFGVNFGVTGTKLKRIVEIMRAIHSGVFTTAPQLTEQLKVTQRTVESDLNFLRERDFISFQGVPKTGKYVLTEKGRNLLETKER